jgi:hypothetical protein
MSDFLECNQNIFLGLYTSLSRTKSSARIVYFKVIEGQAQYFSNHHLEITKEEQEKNQKLLDDAMHKFYLGAYALEQLWGAINYLQYSDHGFPSSFNQKLTYQQNEITFLLSSIFDQVLFSWRSFLDFYLKYLLYFLTGNLENNISTSTFKKSINKHKKKEPKDTKVIEIEKYIKENVFSEAYGQTNHSWGDLLRSLRDKTAHQKLIIPTISIKPNKNGYLISWPTIQGKSYSELAQREFENKCFGMLIDLFPKLYEFDWVSGPFYEGMFKQK